jgi:hypothetical protein
MEFSKSRRTATERLCRAAASGCGERHFEESYSSIVNSRNLPRRLRSKVVKKEEFLTRYGETMTKKKPPADDMMTSAAKAIGSTLGRLAVAAGLEHVAAPASTKAPARKKIIQKSAAKKASMKKSVPRKKKAIVKKAMGRPATKKR